MSPMKTATAARVEPHAVETKVSPGLARRQVFAVAGCYFVASFAALGLPPYLTEILPELGDGAARWAGLLYVVPTIFGAIGAPLWGGSRTGSAANGCCCGRSWGSPRRSCWRAGPTRSAPSPPPW
ncbi:hypothetical protein O1L68_35535 [Streptomyces lydicus]|nr:hypothetical protein [Streptomyces lydicus]